jgi:putative ABC transport system permease protein
MSRWYLYSDFKNGVNVGGRIQYVWLFGIIGIFVLLLACINFMNLSTARSERRAREVGIRKAIGSLRGQLIGQFFAESVLTAFLGFALALLLVSVSLPVFSDLAGKQLVMPWAKPLFWTAGICFCGLTGLIAGSYPALYLSSFRPVEVLKGVFKGGWMAVLPRQVLVVLQFTVSVSLIIGTVVVFRQVRHARERPMGYDQRGYPRPFRCRQAGTARCRCYRRHGAGQRPGDGYLEH